MDTSELWSLELSDLPANLFFKIKNHLDISLSPDQGWRAIVANLRGDFTINDHFERFPSPTTELFLRLRSRGMTVHDFIQCAVAADDHFLMDLFQVYVPAEIIQNPLGEMIVTEGEAIDIVVRARGFPVPRYQWYKDKQKINLATNSVFSCCSASKTDEGHYYCAVYNHDDISRIAISTVTQLQVLPKEEAMLEIKEHPMSCSTYVNCKVVFSCEVWCTDLVSYQWFKDDIQLQDDTFIQGSTTNELRLYIDSFKCKGNYWCQLSTSLNQTFTQAAVLTVIDRQQMFSYTATDKVALLIGCNDYRSDRLLSAPRYDVQTLSNIFQTLKFKVVSLLNLTKSEMIAAVDEFRQLIWHGVYCVFYFCGHGFEIYNQCYLVPVDAPCFYQHTDCVLANDIFNSLQEKDPQICCMILDICRKPHVDRTDVRPSSRPQRTKNGNSIVCYGTSYGLASYESRNCGILVKHLQNVLSLPEDIETVFKKLRENINEDPKLNNPNSERSYKQLPEIRTNLLETQRSFTDPILYSGNTEIFNQKQIIWESAHKKPESKNLDIKFEHFVVKIRLDFQQEFSNVLKIYTSVIDPGPTTSCVAYVSGVPADVAEKAKVKTIANGYECNLKKNFVVIHNIQRLKRPMKINVTVICHGPDFQKTIEVNDLGLPLIAKLELWKERPNYFSTRSAEEAAETEDEG